MLRSPTLSLFVCFNLVYRRVLVCSSEARTLVYDKHTPNCHFNNFRKFFIFATNLEFMCYNKINNRGFKMSDYKIKCGNNKLTFNETTQSCNIIYNGELILINSMDILAFDIKEEIVSGFLRIKKKRYKLLVKTHKYDFLNKCDDDREFVFELSNSDIELVNNIQIMIKERINKNIESYKFQKSHKFMEITVSNVLLKNEDGNERQKILRAFSLRHEEIESFNFEEYNNGNCPAVYVLINNKIIGNIP